MPKSIRFALLLLALVISTPLAAKAVLNQATAAHVRPATALAASTTIPADSLALRIDTPDGPLDLVLAPATQMQAQAAPMVPAIRDGRTHLYRGIVAGQPTSWARMSRIDGAWLGAIQVEGKLWLLDPARQHPQLASRLGLGTQDSVVFTMNDFQGLGPMDFGGVAPPPEALTKAAMPAGVTIEAQTSATHYLGVTLVLDTEFQTHYSPNARSTAIGILNIVDGFYSAQVDTHVYLHALELLASNGTLTATDPNILLPAFRAWLDGSPVPFSGVAHLLSGKDFKDNIVGLAYIGALCWKGWGSGVDQLTFSAAGGAAILAHEMGHNYGANHDSDGNSCPASGYIMNAISYLGHPATEFSTCSLSSFSSYLVNNSPSCLLPRPDRIFDNSFD